MAMRHSSGWSTLISISFFMRSSFRLCSGGRVGLRGLDDRAGIGLRSDGRADAPRREGTGTTRPRAGGRRKAGLRLRMRIQGTSSMSVRTRKAPCSSRSRSPRASISSSGRAEPLGVIFRRNTREPASSAGVEHERPEVDRDVPAAVGPMSRVRTGGAGQKLRQGCADGVLAVVGDVEAIGDGGGVGRPAGRNGLGVEKLPTRRGRGAKPARSKSGGIGSSRSSSSTSRRPSIPRPTPREDRLGRG